jgi:cytochrome c551/c552
MKPVAQRRRAFAVVLLLVLALLTALLASCAPDASQAIISPQLGAQLAAAEAGEVVAAAGPVAAPKLAELTDEQIYAGLPQEVLDALAAADPANGPNVAASNACIGCHNTDPATQMVGPTWHNVGDTAVARVEGESPAFYLYQSIVEPNAHVVPDYPPGVMPQTYGQSLALEDLADLITYLLSQNGQP